MSEQNLSDAGSYKFGQFKKNDKQLEYLKLQATIVLDTEQEAWRQSGLKPGMKVLDLACGPGFTACELAKFIGPDGEVIGIDISEELIAVAHQAKATEGVENVSFAVGNAYELNLSDSSFDFVCARFLFQHLERPLDVLLNILHVLKPGGTLCIVDIDDNWVSFAPESNAVRKVIRQARAGQKRKGGNRMIGTQLYGLLTATGFRDVRTTVFPVTTQDLGVKLFLGLTIVSRLEFVSKVRKLLMLPLLKRIRKAGAAPDAWGAAGIFVATGVKG